jgi:hypothetical protein
VEDGFGLAVDSLSKSQNGICVDIRYESKHSMAVYTRVLKVDTGTAVFTYDDLNEIDARVALVRPTFHMVGAGEISPRLDKIQGPPWFASPYLQLIVPSIGTCSNLYSPINLIATTEHVCTQVVGCFR